MKLNLQQDAQKLRRFIQKRIADYPVYVNLGPGNDEDPITLGAVKDGSFAGTVVQQPFEWGYRGMKLMAKYMEGDKSGIPENKLIIVPTKIIDKANVDQFGADLKAAIGK